MRALEDVLDNTTDYYDNFIDDRFGRRLCQFLTEEQGLQIGFRAADGYKWEQPKEWTEENVLAQLKQDVEFGWEKACDERGISSELMYDTCKAWCKVLENGLEDFDEYGSYGKPLFKVLAHKYGWELPDEYAQFYMGC